ncbi:hypothetical protein J8F10_33115 [Gemmata sp. G18]|uniref:Uncharacterized protein n=1 Tax=Gemmata palustris TaxID=2822762 RepID=A0ABS5C272_9BACT|nr:hypothetical protein [Gemmata palustris]MBP3960092.1 hypothetical protein [Gemmata palustris]
MKLRIGFVAMPLGVFTLCLFFSRWPSRWLPEFSDLVALGLAIASGIWYLPPIGGPIAGRVMVVTGYVVGMTLLLLWYALFFVCAVFCECL